MKEDTITQEQIDKWKAQYKFIYRAKIDGTNYYFRTLSRNDYLAISAKQSALGEALDYELETVKVCLLNDLDEQTIAARSGMITMLSEKIMQRSGFTQVDEEEL